MTRACDTAWSTSPGAECCGNCRCSETGMSLTPVTSPFGEEVFGIFNNASSDGKVSTALAISADKAPSWEADFLGIISRIALENHGGRVEKVTFYEVLQHIQRHITDETILATLVQRLRENTGSQGRMWWFVNDDTGIRWWDWVCYDDMIGSRFNRTEVLHKYDRQYQEGEIAYFTPRQGVSRHSIKSLGPCELFKITYNPRGTASCFFSPYRFLEVDPDTMPKPLILSGTIDASWTHTMPEGYQPGAEQEGALGFSDGNPYRELSGSLTGAGANYREEPEEIENPGSIKDRRVTVQIPAQIFDVLIADPYHWIFTPTYIEFEWKRHDITCRERYNSEHHGDTPPNDLKTPWHNFGPLVSCRDYPDTPEGKRDQSQYCQKYLGSYYEGWTGGHNVTVSLHTKQQELIGYIGGMLFPGMGVINIIPDVYLADTLYTEESSEMAGIWADMNVIMAHQGLYFRCDNPSRWANIKISQYGIMPGKVIWTEDEGRLTRGTTRTTDPDTGAETIDYSPYDTVNLEDKWACGDRSHLADHVRDVTQHNIWIVTGRAADYANDIDPEPERAVRLIDEAWAYNYKYEVSTNGLLVRKPIKEYAPIPDYPDEVEKRNFAAELEERMKAFEYRRHEILPMLEEINIQIEILQRQVNRQLGQLNNELNYVQYRWNELQQRYGNIDIIYEEGEEREYDPVRLLQRKINIVIAQLEETDNEAALEQARNDLLRVVELWNENTRIQKELVELLLGTPELRTLKQRYKDLQEEYCLLDIDCVLSWLDDSESILFTYQAELAGIEGDLPSLQNQWNALNVVERYGERGKEIQAQIDALINSWTPEQRVRRTELEALIREHSATVQKYLRASWEFLPEDEKVEEEIKEIQKGVDELEAEFRWWRINHAHCGGDTGINCPDTITPANPEYQPHIDRFGPQNSDWCYWMIYQRTINIEKKKISNLQEYIQDAIIPTLLDPYIWQFDTFLWGYPIQEGMAYYKIQPEDTTDPDNPKSQKGWGKGRGIGHRTNWDFSWARGYKVSGSQLGRHCIQTSRKSIGGVRCLAHYVEKDLINQEDTVDNQLRQAEMLIEEIQRRITSLPPDAPEITNLRNDLNRALRDLEYIRAEPEDAKYKKQHSWDERIIPLSDYTPYGIVGRTILSMRGGSAPVPPSVAIPTTENVSDWRKKNDPLVRNNYIHIPGTGNQVSQYRPKEGTNLIHNLIEPKKIIGYNLVKDKKFKWQRRRYLSDGQGNYEVYWENDPNNLDVTEFLVWYDGSSFIQKPYKPDERLGGLLYKTESHKYVPSLAQRAPINTGKTNRERLFIHNAYFVNRRQAFGAIDCQDGLLMITFFDHNYPIDNPAPRGQLPFWHGEIVFAANTLEREEWVQHRDFFIATKGGSGWVCNFNNHESLLPEIHGFRAFWWHGGSYFIRNDWGVFRIVPTNVGIELKKETETLDNSPLFHPKMIRATVFTGTQGAVIGRTNTSGSTWTIRQSIPYDIDVRDVFPLGAINSFNEQIDLLEEQYLELYDEYDNLWWKHFMRGENVEPQLLDLWDRMLILLAEIRELKKNEPPPLVFFNILRPNLQQELKEIDELLESHRIKIRIAEEENRHADVVRLNIEMERISKLMHGPNKYNIGIMIAPMEDIPKDIRLRQNIHYTVLAFSDRIKRIQFIDCLVFILTEKGRIYQGLFTNNPRDFSIKQWYLAGNHGPILDFWMNSAVTGRVIFENMYQTGNTTKVEYASEAANVIYWLPTDQTMITAIEDEPYNGSSCNVMLFDSNYNNPYALVNYKGYIWQLKDKQWRYVNKIKDSWMTARWTMEFNLKDECKEASGTWDIITSIEAGSFYQRCGISENWVTENEIDDDLDYIQLPPHNLNYDSIIGDGNFTRDKLIGVQNVADLNTLVTIIQTASTSRELEELRQYAYFGGDNLRFFEKIMFGLSITPRELQFEYIDSVRDLIMIGCVYDKYFYVKSNKSLWEYDGLIWKEFIRFTNGYPVKSQQEYIEMKGFLDSTGNQYEINEDEEARTKKNENPSCERVDRYNEMILTLERMDDGDFLTIRLNEISELLQTTIPFDTLSNVISRIRRIINEPTHPNYPRGDCPEGFQWDRIAEWCRDANGNPYGGDEELMTPQDKVERIEQLVQEMVNYSAQASVETRQTLYVLQYTLDLINNDLIPLFGEAPQFIDLIGAIKGYQIKTFLSLKAAIDLYEQAYSIASGLMSGDLFYDMSAGDFFVQPNPCEPAPKIERGEECNWSKKYGNIMYLGIQNIFHKPREDSRKSRVLNFFPAENKEFIIHGDKWSRDSGRSWLEWNHCVGPCRNCKSNAADMGVELPNIIIGSNTDKIWENDVWVWEKIIDDCVTIPDFEGCWTDDNLWWYKDWSINVCHDNYIEEELAKLKTGTTACDEVMYEFRVKYFMAGIQHLLRFGGQFVKEVRDGDIYVLKLDNPPDLRRDNREFKEELRNDLLRVTGVSSECRMWVTDWIENIPDSSLYHEEYCFVIEAVGC